MADDERFMDDAPPFGDEQARQRCGCLHPHAAECLLRRCPNAVALSDGVCDCGCHKDDGTVVEPVFKVESHAT